MNFYFEDSGKTSEFTTNENSGKNIPVESDALAKDWLKTHSNSFAGFVSNNWLPKSEASVKVSNPFTSEYYADVFLPSVEVLENAANSSFDGLNKWKSLSASQRSDYLLKIATNIEKHADLFALVECITSGKTLYRTETRDVPNFIQSFKYYASWAYAEEKKIGCAETDLRLFFGSITNFKELPDGVLNVLPINDNTLTCFPNVNKVIFTGGFLRSEKFTKMAALQGIPCETTVSRQPVVIIYENADLDSAVDGVLETFYYSDTRSERSGCKVLVQSSVQKKIMQLLEIKFADTYVGVNISKSDMTCIVTKEQKEKLVKDIEEAKNHGVKVVEGPDVNSENELHRAVLLSNVPMTSNLLCEPLGGPIVIVVPFRTVKESISMFNHDKIMRDVSIWSENLTLALEVVHQLKAGTVWVNSEIFFDASAVYGGMGSLDGGNEAFMQHLDFGISEFKKYSKEEAEQEIANYGKELPPGISIKSDTKIKQSCESFIGGSYKSGNTYTILSDHKQAPYAYVTRCSTSDVREAISNAIAAQPKWESLNKYKRFEILRKAATMLSGKKDEFAAILHDLIGEELDVCKEEVDKSVACLHHWAIHVATSCGEIVDTLLYGRVLKDRCPLGVIGIQSPDKFPLLSFLSLVSSAIALGNAVVVIPSENCPIPALKMCEIFKSAGVPSNIVNVITGGRSYLTRQLTLNKNINAIWFGVDGAAFIYHSCDVRPQRIFNCKNIWKLETEKNFKLILESTWIKTTYMPMGTIFSN
ncbi:hypothetical protein TNIN_346621 [Trichonephila inaurata madagascariensis]|uniref:Aldehyde dehydrogenase domain-containing protein n=1 Tax=Trichonephila inaurata madagascariensis TaxID=2747483 RepID=A0A8X6XW73_9ARAC|nr:hypothetical protein TNIN_346621 [Trichonephila inaurata madagascariensis]